LNAGFGRRALVDAPFAFTFGKGFAEYKIVDMGTIKMCCHCGGSFAGTLALCPEDGKPLFAPEVVARIGMRLKDHVIQGVIGEGGMGVVYRAQHVVLEKPVAIKVLHDRFAKQTESIEQFILEAKAASRIRHPNIIDVTDIGTTDEGLVFMVMEYLDGENLEDRLRRTGRLPLFNVINILGQVARGLGAAHELGIVHRDLKPGNIFLVNREGRRRVVRRLADNAGVRFEVEPEGNYDVAKLLDFGVAKFLDLGPSAATRAGVVCGTPYYLSPEQAQEEPADARSDIYALGAVFYEMITGVVPFSGSSLLEILTGHVAGTVIPPSQRAPDAGIDAHTDAVVLKCLAKNPDDRFDSTDAFGDALRDCVGDRAFLRDAERLPGIREAGFELLPESFEPRDFSKTKRFHRARAQGTRDLIVGLALVLLVGAGIALWLLHDRAPAVAAIRLPISPPQASSHVLSIVPLAAPPPAIEAPSGSSAGSPAVAHPPTDENTAPVGLGGEKKSRRMPVSPTISQPRPMAGASAIAAVASVPAPPKSAPPTIMPAAVPAAVAPATVANPAADAEALLHEAQKAWVRKYYAVAIDRARAALAVSPDLPLAHQIITICSCGLHRDEDAKLAFAHLDPARRNLVRTLCEKDGVVLDSD
jgi:serine/threonine-protein kinase